MSEIIAGKEILEVEVISEHPVSQFEKEAKSEIAVFVKDLEPETSAAVSAAYLNFLAQAKEWKDEALSIVVTEASQKEKMKAAKEMRLTLQKVRTGADKVRKTLKEDSNKYGKAVQAVYNEIENLIAPLEKHLMDQEKFVEVQEAKRKAAIKVERISIINSCEEGDISPYIPFKIDLSELSDTEFQNLYDGAKLQLVEKIRKEKEEKVLRFRQEKLAQIGLRLCDAVYQYRDIKFHRADIISLSDEGFDDAFNKAKARREELDKEDENRIVQENRQSYRVKKMAQLGLKFDGEQFSYKDINFHQTDLLIMSDEEFEKAFFGAEKRRKQLDEEEAEKAEELRKENERLRIETGKANKELSSIPVTAAAPLSVNGKTDIEKLQSLANLLRSLQIPVVESEEAKTILRSAVEGIKGIAETLESDIAWMR